MTYYKKRKQKKNRSDKIPRRHSIEFRNYITFAKNRLSFWDSAIKYCAIKYCAIKNCAIKYCAIKCCAIKYCAIKYSAIKYAIYVYKINRRS